MFIETLFFALRLGALRYPVINSKCKFRRTMKIHARTVSFLLLVALFCFLPADIAAQSNNQTTPSTSSQDQKAEDIIKHAIEALGGDNYVNVRSVVGRG